MIQVACLADNDGHLALEKDDPYVIQQKPHGHGDVHALLHSTGLVKQWQKNGVQWVCFFQDTNGLVFRALPAALGKQSMLGPGGDMTTLLTNSMQLSTDEADIQAGGLLNRN